jgi:hypothetical protein
MGIRGSLVQWNRPAMHDDQDRGSKWMITHHGDAILRFAGITGFSQWRPLTVDVVQPRRLPDGLIEAAFPGQDQADLFLLEVFSYPDARAERQIFEKMALVFLDRGILPEVVAIYLQSRGNVQVQPHFEQASRLGSSSLHGKWRQLELWRVPVADLLQTGEAGLLPWIPLCRSEEPETIVARKCREQIDTQASPEERNTLLAVALIMARFRYNDPELLKILGGSQAMESPFIVELLAQTRQDDIIQVLEGRFGGVPPEIVLQLRAIQDERRLKELTRQTGVCQDLEAFRKALES